MKETDLIGLRLGAYVRISSDLQEGGSRNQKTEIQQFVDRLGLHVVDWYVDDEGKNPRGKRNPHFLRMMKDAENGRINGIVFAYLIRLGFVNDEIGWFTTSLRNSSIPCWDIRQGRDLRECGSDPDLWEKVARETVRSAKDLQDMGHKQLVRHLDQGRRGLWAGGAPPYGIDLLYTTPDGQALFRYVDMGGYKDNRKRLKIMPDGARVEYNGRNNCPPKDKYAVVRPCPTIQEERLTVVRLMFEWADVEGLSAYQIAGRLNSLGYRTAHGKLWPHVTINLMLANPIYVGLPRQGQDSAAKYAYLDAQGNIKDKFEPTPVRRRSQCAAVQPKQPIFEPIVPVDQCERVQKRLKPRTSPEGKRRYSSRCPDAWARGLLYCGQCGHKMIVVHDGKRMYWRCGSRFAYGDCGQCPGCRVPDAKIEQIVAEYLRWTKAELRKDQQHDYDFGIEQMKVKCAAMRFGEDNATEIARLDADDDQHRAAIKDLTEKVKRLTSTAGIEILDQAIKEHERAILDNKWKREELQEQLTPEEMVSRIEQAEKAKAESKARAYNEFLKTVIQKIVCHVELLPVRRGHRKYDLTDVVIVPVNGISPATIESGEVVGEPTVTVGRPTAVVVPVSEGMKAELRHLKELARARKAT